MRNLLVVPVLASLLLSTVRPADACGGGYVPIEIAPALMRISSHHAEGGTRSFVLTGEAVPPTATAWTRLDPGSFDNASIAEAPDLEQPMSITLIGPGGTRVISSRDRVYLSNTFVARAPSVALELALPNGRFEIAMIGSHAGATWSALTAQRSGRANDIAWVKARGVAPALPESVQSSRIAGTYVSTVVVLPKEGPLVTFVRQGNDVIAQFEGSPLGVITNGRRRYLVMSTHGQAPVARAF